MKKGIATFSLDTERYPRRLSISAFSIPTSPQIPLRNYLLDLINEADGKESSIYLIGVERHIQYLWRDMNTLNPRTLFIGWICGDGDLEQCGNHYLIKISEKSIPQLDYVLKPLFHSLFSVEPNIYQIYEGGYALQIGAKPIYRFLMQALPLRVGEIPGFVFNLDWVDKKYFLAGISDSEGYVSKKGNRLTISQADPKFLLQVLNLLSSLGINFRGPVRHETRLGLWYSIWSQKKSEILKFSECIGSYHLDKSKALDRMVSHIKS
jgi:hypothetical protein